MKTAWQSKFLVYKCLGMPENYPFITPCPEIIPNFMSDAICYSLLNKIIERLQAKIIKHRSAKPKNFRNKKHFCFNVIIIWFLLTLIMTITFTVHIT